MKKNVVLTAMMICVISSVSFGFTISGHVRGKNTLAPLDNIYVSCWNDTLQEYDWTYTGPDGVYSLTVNAGECSLLANPDSTYGRVSQQIEVDSDLTGIDFLLPLEVIVSGRLVDMDTGEPIPNTIVWYENDVYQIWTYEYSDADGLFSFDRLPPGAVEINAEPEVSTGYASDLPWGLRDVYLEEGRTYSDNWIALRKGALVTGRVVDSLGNPVPDLPVSFVGRACDGDRDADSNGEYQFRLPVGDYIIVPETDDDEDGPIGSEYPELTITGLSPVALADITCYTAATGESISGTVNKTNAVPNTGMVEVIAFPAGTDIDPADFYRVEPTVVGVVEPNHVFALEALPPGSYDLHLIQYAYTETPEDYESITILDSAEGIAAGTTGVILENGPGSVEVTGTVHNIFGKPLVFSMVLLLDASGPGDPVLAGFGDVDTNGNFRVYNIHPGTYTVYAIHAKCGDLTFPVTITGPTMQDLGTITMQFDGQKEASDLNGDGLCNLEDAAVISSQWLDSGTLPADMDQSGVVDLDDLLNWGPLWLWKAMWLAE